MKTKKRRLVNNNIIMLTTLVTILLGVLIFNQIHYVKADHSSAYQKSFVSIEIQSGDTLISIAQEYAISEADYESYIEEIKSINNLKGNTIHAGCYLMIPVYSIS